MKRARENDEKEDVEVASQSKKAGGSGGSGEAGGSVGSEKAGGSWGSETAAFAYLMSVKLKVSGSLYTKFLVLLRDFRTCRINVDSLRLQVKKLFAGYGDLILGFNVFLPEPYKISLDEEDEEEETNTEPEIEEEDENLDSGKFEEALGFVNKVKLRFRKGDQHVYKAFLDLLRAPSLEKKKVFNFEDYSKAAQLLGDHPDLLQDFDRLIGPAWKASDGSNHQSVTVEDPDREVKTKLLKQGLNLCDKVEQVLSDSDYHEFLRKLYDYSSGKITRDDLKAAVTDILGSDRSIDGNLVEEVTSFINAPEEHLSKLWKFEEKNKEQKQIKSVYQLDLSKCKRISPSYWLLPKAYRVSPSTQISKNDQVLNDKFVCLSVRGGNYSFKHRRIQEREEILFRCEDDRYEMDMLMEYIRSAIEKVRKLLNAIEEKKVNLEIGMTIEDHLSIFNRRCIEKLYGEYGLEMMDVMQEKPTKALPVILKRLEQKQQELTKFRDDFNKLCAHIYAKNFSNKSSSECSVEERDHMMQQTVNEQALALQGAVAGE